MADPRAWAGCPTRGAADYCDCLCALGDWARDYGKGSGDDLGFITCLH